MAAPGEEERLAPDRGVAGLAMLATGVISARLARHPEIMGWTLGDTIAPISAGTVAVTACAAAWLTAGRARSIAGLVAAAAVALACFELFAWEVPRRRGVVLVAAGLGSAFAVARGSALLARSPVAMRGLFALTAIALAIAARPLLLEPSARVRAEERAALAAAWDDRRAIVLVTMDTTRRDALGPYGAGPEATPFLDDFARRATRFTRAASTSPFTAPSMGSLLTGLSPLDHGSVSGSPALNADVTTLAEHCGELGLATAGFLDNPWLGEEFGLARGYQTLWRTTDLEDVEGWLDEHAHRPFFLHVHLFTPHGPYVLREEYADALGLELASNAARTHGPEIGARVIQGGEIPTRHGFDGDGIAWLRDLHRTEVRAMDAWIGGLLRALDARGLTERSVIAVTADHGEEFGDRGGLHHSHTLFGELVDVPLLIAAPGAGPGVNDEPVSLRALPRLLLEAARWPVEDGFVGGAPGLTASIRLRQGGRHLLRVADGSWSLHLRVLPGDERRPEPALYSRTEDPGERHDLSGERPDVVRDLIARPEVTELIERLRATPLAPGDADATPLAGWTRRQLRALGYAR